MSGSSSTRYRTFVLVPDCQEDKWTEQLWIVSEFLLSSFLYLFQFASGAGVGSIRPVVLGRLTCQCSSCVPKHDVLLQQAVPLRNWQCNRCSTGNILYVSHIHINSLCVSPEKSKKHWIREKANEEFKDDHLYRIIIRSLSLQWPLFIKVCLNLILKLRNHIFLLHQCFKMLQQVNH